MPSSSRISLTCPVQLAERIFDTLKDKEVVLLGAGEMIKTAARILKEAQGWGSSVIVGVVAHGVPLSEYLPLLESVSRNGWTELAFVEGRKPGFIDDNIRRLVRQRTQEQGAKANRR